MKTKKLSSLTSLKMFAGIIVLGGGLFAGAVFGKEKLVDLIKRGGQNVNIQRNVPATPTVSPQTITPTKAAEPSVTISASPTPTKVTSTLPKNAVIHVFDGQTYYCRADTLAKVIQDERRSNEILTKTVDCRMTNSGDEPGTCYTNDEYQFMISWKKTWSNNCILKAAYDKYPPARKMFE